MLSERLTCAVFLAHDITPMRHAGLDMTDDISRLLTTGAMPDHIMS